MTEHHLELPIIIFGLIEQRTDPTELFSLRVGKCSSVESKRYSLNRLILLHVIRSSVAAGGVWKPAVFNLQRIYN